MHTTSTRLHCSLLALASALTLVACGGGDDSTETPQPTELAQPALAFTQPGESLDLANYTLVGKYNLQVGSGSNLLASEVSAVAWNKDTDSLFIVGDNGTSVTQISKTGQLIDSMTLPADANRRFPMMGTSARRIPWSGNTDALDERPVTLAPARSARRRWHERCFSPSTRVGVAMHQSPLSLVVRTRCHV